jgi:hypothetical protein
MLHVSFQPPNSPFPAILPMIGQMGSFERPSAGLGDVLDLYLHGSVVFSLQGLNGPPTVLAARTRLTPEPSYVSSRVMNLTRTSADGSPEGLPVTIAATHLDGLVLSLTPNSRKCLFLPKRTSIPSHPLYNPARFPSQSTETTTTQTNHLQDQPPHIHPTPLTNPPLL